MPTNIPQYLSEVHPAEHAYQLLKRARHRDSSKSKVRIVVDPVALLDSPAVRQAALVERLLPLAKTMPTCPEISV